MISANNSDYSNSEMKKVNEALKRKFIYVDQLWLKKTLEGLTGNLEDKVYREVIKSDLSKIVDKTKVKELFDLTKLANFEDKSKIVKTNLFLQINGYANIAEAHSEKKKGESLLDVLENFESKFLQAEGEETKKVEKTILKFEMTDGVETIFGFEYEDLKELKNKLEAGDKFPKVLLGPELEIRRGIIYLTGRNIKLL